MAVIKKKINGEHYEVFTEENLPSNPNLLGTDCAMLIGDTVYPFRRKNDKEPGLYRTGMSMGNIDVLVAVDPVTDKQREEYDIHTNCVNFENLSGITDYIHKIDEMKKMERSTLMNINDIFKPAIHQDDTREMKAFKYAVGLKNCDIAAYKGRFGSNYNNDKRLFEKDKISIGKMAYLTDILDMSIEIIFRDKDPKVANPMGEEVRVVLNDSNVDFDQFLYQKDLEEQAKMAESAEQDSDPTEWNEDCA